MFMVLVHHSYFFKGYVKWIVPRTRLERVLIRTVLMGRRLFRTHSYYNKIYRIGYKRIPAFWLVKQHARFFYWHTVFAATRIMRKPWPLWHHNDPIVGYAHSARKYAVRAMHPVKFTHASSKICHASVKMSSTFLHGHASSKFLLQDAW